MTSLRTWPLFRLSLAALAGRGSCWLLLLGALLFVWIAPLLTPWEVNPQILQPAQAQAAWVYAWLALFTWLPFQASALGHRLRREGMLEHLQAAGVGKVGQCLQLTAAILVWMLALVVIAIAICFTFTMPKRPEEVQMWMATVWQYSALYSLCAAPLLLLAVSLGTRTAEVIAFMLPVGLLFIGLFGAAWLGPILGGAESGVLKSLWLALPHYHLADLTPRLVFKMGPLPAADFMGSILTLALQGAALSLFGLCLFRTRS
ncbi:hypothetical protein EI77_02010 [Prosthecobacter fusiformis]|uniref:ABC-2 type transport system permease protein n=1 Tax=Prosthecobacter fusiformis TaxID=48464 RepID=A0A4R7RYF0_9BACT|nr:ABC transporter permease [Prosthecobacter fusiformis]TDU70892.1 hypothetical protein EI77_02010 [Prosthecobacter fusiformis]